MCDTGSTVPWTAPGEPTEVAIRTPCGDLGEAALYPRSTMDFVLLLKTESSAAKAGLQHTLQLRMTLNFLLRPPKCCNCKPVPPCLAHMVLGTESGASFMPDKPCTNCTTSPVLRVTSGGFWGSWILVTTTSLGGTR